MKTRQEKRRRKNYSQVPRPPTPNNKETYSEFFQCVDKAEVAARTYRYPPIYFASCSYATDCAKIT